MFLKSTSKISVYVQEKKVSNRVDPSFCESPVSNDHIEIVRPVLFQESDTLNFPVMDLCKSWWATSVITFARRLLTFDLP
jgi:hypothetical protein